jgi:hypothetical protein
LPDSGCLTRGRSRADIPIRARGGLFATLNSKFPILNSLLSILYSKFSIPHSLSTIHPLNFQFSTLYPLSSIRPPNSMKFRVSPPGTPFRDGTHAFGSAGSREFLDRQGGPNPYPCAAATAAAVKDTGNCFSLFSPVFLGVLELIAHVAKVLFNISV